MSIEIFANIDQLKEIDLGKINTDNIRVYDHLIKNNGVVITLDVEPYVEFLEEQNIFYEVVIFS